jgi:Tetratricopeptide repeat
VGGSGLEPYASQPRPVSQEQARQQPGRLLAAESQVVSFAGRQDELADLAGWRDDPAPGVSVMLVHGPGGQGKTRLAAQFAADSVRDGWTAWAAHQLSDPAGATVVTPGNCGTDLVVVADNAERWPADDLLLLMQNPLLRHPQRARVLLVARASGPWWLPLRHRLGKAGIAVHGSIALPPLAASGPERRTLFAAAADCFAAVFKVPAAVVTAPEILDRDEDAYRLVLTVHTAALVAVDAAVRGKIPPSDPVGLSAYLLDREHDYWQSVCDYDPRVTSTPEVIGRTVYIATMTRPLGRPQARAVLERAGIVAAVAADAADRALDDHAICYPPAAPGLAELLEPLYPDRLGEDFIALTTPGHAVADYPPDEWASAVPARLLDPADRPDPPAAWTRPVVAMLIQTAARWPHIARQFEAILRQHPELAMAGGGAALARLSDFEHFDPAILEVVESQFPELPQADLAAGIAAVTQRLTDHRLPMTEDPAQRALLHSRLGYRLSHAGQPKEALAAASEAVAIRRRMAEADPAAAGPELALSLANLGALVSEAGWRPEAVCIAEEAVAANRALAAADPAAFEPGLARSLNNHAVLLGKAGMRKEALAAAKDAVALWSRLAADAPAAFEPDLAESLNTLGGSMWGTRHRKAALAASEQAVAIFRRLAATNPAAFEPDLARTLADLGIRLSDLGRRNEAHAATAAAVSIYRRLAAASPAAFEPELARSLGNLGVDLEDAGRPADGLAATSEAVELWRRLAAGSPAAFDADLAGALNNLASGLWRTRRREESVAIVEQIAAIQRRLAESSPDIVEPELRATLLKLSVGLRRTGRRHEAGAARTEAAAVHRRIAARHQRRHSERRHSGPAIDEAGLARALTDLGNLLADAGRNEQAHAAAREASEIYRPLAAGNPATYEPDLARSLLMAAWFLLKTGEGLPLCQDTLVQAADIYQRLAEDQPARYAKSLQTVQSLRADLSDLLGRSPIRE